MPLNETQKRTLERFIKRSERIANSGLIRAGFKPNHKIEFSNGSINFQGTELDEDHLGALFNLVRPFISEKDHLNVDKIFNLIRKSGSPAGIISQAQLVRDHHVARLGSQSTIQMHGDQTLDNKAMFKLIANTEYAHDDPDKAQFFESLGDIGQLMGREQFIEYIYAHVWTIFELTSTLRELLVCEG